jgi:hypothetical protein
MDARSSAVDHIEAGLIETELTDKEGKASGARQSELFYFLQ